MIPDDASVVLRHRILRPLGEGGMGVVYEAEQLEPVRRRVALTVLKVGMDTMAFVARFEAERQALAVMDHAESLGCLTPGRRQRGGRTTRWSTSPAYR